MAPKPITRAMSVTPVLALLIAGCGGTSPASPHTRTAVVATAAAISRPRPPVAHLRIISPRAGAHTGSSVAVRVRLGGDRTPGPRAFLYVLDRQPPRRAGDRLILRHLHPGRHRLVVRVGDGARAVAAVAFIVRAPAPLSVPALGASTPVPAAPSTAAATTPSPGTPTSTSPSPTTSTAPQHPGGIPQNNGGDGDADNNGGPTDGDGNI